MNEKALLIEELKEEHKKQRAWQRMVNDEELNIELLESMSIDELKNILQQVKK